jgi:phenylalanyl-tRNA synthetase alpha chain
MNLEKTIRNFPPHLEEKMHSNLYKQKNHPLNIIKNKIVNYFSEENTNKNNIIKTTLINSKIKIQIYEDLPKIVDLSSNFYSLLVNKDHETLSPKNTYYWDNENVLRTHMTAHDVKLMKEGCRYFLSIGDVYRRDEIDSTHYPIFHQVDSVRVFDVKELLNMENPYKNLIDLSENNSQLCSEEVVQNKKEINLLNQNINLDVKHCLDIVTSDLKYTLQNLNR